MGRNHDATFVVVPGLDWNLEKTRDFSGPTFPIFLHSDVLHALAKDPPRTLDVRRISPSRHDLHTPYPALRWVSLFVEFPLTYLSTKDTHGNEGFQTAGEIRATFAACASRSPAAISASTPTIDDYPIGRRERGKCRLQVERAQGKGYRTVRTTTNKSGRWCAPKKSTYSNSLIVVVRD